MHVITCLTVDSKDWIYLALILCSWIAAQLALCPLFPARTSTKVTEGFLLPCDKNKKKNNTIEILTSFLLYRSVLKMKGRHKNKLFSHCKTYLSTFLDIVNKNLLLHLKQS